MAKAPVSDEPKEPANLRRKIQAKRPPLGHVIPQSVRVKGGKSRWVSEALPRDTRKELAVTINVFIHFIL